MGYFTTGRGRAGRRQTKWNLLLIPAYILPWSLLIAGLALLLGSAYRMFHPGSEFVVFPDTIGGILMAAGSLFACLGPSMILANELVAMVPAARAALDREGRAADGTTREAANRGLLRMSCTLTPAGLALSSLGVVGR